MQLVMSMFDRLRQRTEDDPQFPLRKPEGDHTAKRKGFCNYVYTSATDSYHISQLAHI